jgi:nitrogen-specific signal transduction histidine kinase
VKQILTFSRRGEQQRLLVNLKPVVAETFNFLKATLPSSIEVRQNLRADAGAVILADPTQMQQVLMNLCTNAAHAMENQENGILEIDLEKAVLTEEQARFEPDVEPGEFVKLTVADNGPGIESWVRERMFEPYFTTKGQEGDRFRIVRGTGSSRPGLIKAAASRKRDELSCFPSRRRRGRKDRGPPGHAAAKGLRDDSRGGRREGPGRHDAADAGAPGIPRRDTDQPAGGDRGVSRQPR